MKKGKLLLLGIYCYCQFVCMCLHCLGWRNSHQFIQGSCFVAATQSDWSGNSLSTCKYIPLGFKCIWIKLYFFNANIYICSLKKSCAFTKWKPMSNNMHPYWVHYPIIVLNAQIVTWWPCPLTFQLLPADAKIKEYHQKEADEAKAYVRKLSVVNLAEKSEEVKEPEVVKIDLVS